VSRKLGFHDDLRGLVDLVSDPRLALRDVVLQRPPFHFFLVPAGRKPEDPYRVLSSPRFAEIVRATRDHFDWIILDCPPLLAVPDARVVGDCVDGFLLVVGADRTPRKLLEETLNEIEPEKVCGIVLNGDRRILSGYSKYYRAYGYTASAQKLNQKKAGAEAA
jgi:tyrosine-protein kinase Etk/Wzc